VPAGGTRLATGPASVTVAEHVVATPGESAFGVQLIESFVGLAAAPAFVEKTNTGTDAAAHAAKRKHLSPCQAVITTEARRHR
jgi:hypothetical protein